MALAGERSELPGHRRQHAGFNNCVEGAYGIARFAEREAVDSDEHARSTCGVRDPRRRLVRRWVWQWTVAGRRPTAMVCWWRSDDLAFRHTTAEHVAVANAAELGDEASESHSRGGGRRS